jgi:tetratricopeptide (TPR) repeat protein
MKKKMKNTCRPIPSQIHLTKTNMSLEKKSNATDASLQGAGGLVGGLGEKKPSDPSVSSDPFLPSALDDKTDLRRRRSEKYRECRRRESEWGELHSDRGVESGSLEAGTELKERGNAMYARGDYQGALGLYWEALEVLPWIAPPSLNLLNDDKGSGDDKTNKSEGGAESPAEEGGIKTSLPSVPLSPLHTLRSVCHCNRAACFATQEKWECALWDCDRALEINPSYSKALARRGAVLEKLDLLDDALTDYKALVALDPGKATAGARKDEERVLKLIQARDEKLKVSERDVDRGRCFFFQISVTHSTYLTYATTLSDSLHRTICWGS